MHIKQKSTPLKVLRTSLKRKEKLVCDIHFELANPF